MEEIIGKVKIFVEKYNILQQQNVELQKQINDLQQKNLELRNQINNYDEQISEELNKTNNNQELNKKARTLQNYKNVRNATASDGGKKLKRKSRRKI